MTTPAIILVYDGDCPVCRNYTQHLSIKQAAGTFELLNARDSPPILQEINALNLDMDQGFVLKIGDQFYHGADAIHTLALLSTRTGVFNRLNFLVFKSKTLSRVLYPILKTGRALLLALLGNSKLNNLENRQ
ncbi:MAG: DCC1-like thiol-disulfide oxidoreductase family protein [Anderseniella sp.]|jgi:predicted DCC family thiol-disulfide oxidoreductase YuxK